MRILLKTLLKVFFVAFVFGYIPLLVISYYVEPDTSGIDMCFIQEHGDHSSLGLYGYKLLESKKPKIPLLGASGVMHGMRPVEFEERFHSFQATNHAVSGTNISGIWEMLDATRTTLSEEVLKKTYFVIGIFFGTFIENRVRYGKFRKDKKHKPDCKESIVKMGHYAFDGESVYPVLPSWLWKIRVHAERPYLLFPRKMAYTSKFYSELFNPWYLLIRRAQADPFKLVDGSGLPQNKKTAVKFWFSFMDRPNGDLADEQFDVLMQMLDYIEKNKLNVLIVDLPIASWHNKHSKLYEDYQKRKTPFFNRIRKSKYAQFLNMQELDNAEYFSDSVHVNASHTYMWADFIKKHWPFEKD